MSTTVDRIKAIEDEMVSFPELNSAFLRVFPSISLLLEYGC